MLLKHIVMKTLDKVIEVIKANKKNCLDILPASNLTDDLGLDSFDALMIVNAIEDEFHLTFDGLDLMKIKTVNDIVEIIDSKVKV